MYASDVTTMLADFGIAVTKSTTTVRGILEVAQRQVAQDGLTVDEITAVHLKAGALSGLARGDTLTLADTSTVTEVTRAFGASSVSVTVRDLVESADGEMVIAVVVP